MTKLCRHCGTQARSPKAAFCRRCGAGLGPHGRPPQRTFIRPWLIAILAGVFMLISAALVSLSFVFGAGVTGKFISGLTTEQMVAIVAAHATSLADNTGGEDRLIATELVEQEILNLTNVHREDHGVAPLMADAVLTHVARQRSEDMITRSYYSHDDPQTGETLIVTLAVQNGLTGQGLAEVIDRISGPPTVLLWFSPQMFAEMVVQDWLSSPGHREAILSGEFSRSGGGLSLSADGKTSIATQVLGGP